MKASSILGLNARTQIYSYRYNSARGKKIAASKILTKRVLLNNSIPSPRLYAKFKTPQDIIKFKWESLPDAFAIKPSKGLGGDGIIVIKKRAKDKSGWITVRRQKVTIEDLKFHAFDILEGAYSVGNIPDVAFIEEYVGRHKAFRRYSYRGTPDIRVIVFNKVPVMAMLRLPTKESGGRANLFQGAIAVGVDIATGITTKAFWHGNYIKYKPETKRKLNGIKIPHWDEILEVAVRCQMVSHLGYLGVDVVLHPSGGPMILELNSQPGLKIQLANMAGLKRRLERVDEMEVHSPSQGVKIAKALFADRFADRVRIKEGIKIIKAAEEIQVKSVSGERHKVIAKIDTGAWSSSIDKKLAQNLGLYAKSRVLWHRKKISSLGEEKRPVINVSFYLSGRRIKTTMTVANRSKLTYPVIIGRVDLDGFLVNPEIDASKREEASKW